MRIGIAAVLLVTCAGWVRAADAPEYPPSPLPALSPTAEVSPSIQAVETPPPTFEWKSLPGFSGSAATVESLPVGRRATAAASADFDTDGMPDLVVGYTTSEDSVVALFRGNPNSIHPYTPLAHRVSETDPGEPFEREILWVPAPTPPDYLVAGDFDGDGDNDLIVASVGASVLYLLPGDGAGGFHDAQARELDGSITALQAGEVNHRDGLQDLMVGLDGSAGAFLAIFQSSHGALTEQPEPYPVPHRISSLASGSLGDDPTLDVAFIAEGRLFILEGHARPLHPNADDQAARDSRRLVSVPLREPAIEVIVGRFLADRSVSENLGVLSVSSRVRILRRTGPADASFSVAPWTVAVERSPATTTLRENPKTLRRHLFCASAVGRGGPHLLLLHDTGGIDRLTVAVSTGDGDSTPTLTVHSPISGPVSAVLPMRLNGDGQPDLVVLPEDGDPMMALSGADATIVVNSAADDAVPGNGACTMREALINANNDADSSGGDCAAGRDNDEIEFNIDGGGNVATITLGEALPSISSPLTIDGASQDCPDPPCIELDGTAAVGGACLTVLADNSVIRGLAIGHCNGDGIRLLSDGSLVEGNFLGLDVSGITAAPNAGHGVRVFGSLNTIGGTVPAARNVASANREGITIRGFSSSNVVQGNYVGTDVTGTMPIGNAQQGIWVYDTSNATLGGTGPFSGNLISANGHYGVTLGVVGGGASGTVIQGNRVGTDVTGTQPLGNGYSGISAFSAPGTTIGGASPGAGNLSSANSSNGMLLSNVGTTGCLVLGNRIGSDITGSLALGNLKQGIKIQRETTANTIGGTAPGDGNLIMANSEAGVLAVDGFGNSILGNEIHDNGALGIDLGEDDVTQNDPLDPDSGPNDLQNYPVLDSVSATPADVSISGSINSHIGVTYHIEFFANRTCNPLGHGEGGRFIGSTVLTTDMSGDALIDISLPAAVSDGEAVTSTATDPAGSTSEFSRCEPAACTSLSTFNQTIVAVGPTTLAWGNPADVAFAKGDLADVSDYLTAVDGVLFMATELDVFFDEPSVGKGFYYLVRPLGCGSWQTQPGAEPDRDLALP